MSLEPHEVRCSQESTWLQSAASSALRPAKMDRMPKLVCRAGASNFGDQIHMLLPYTAAPLTLIAVPPVILPVLVIAGLGTALPIRLLSLLALPPKLPSLSRHVSPTCLPSPNSARPQTLSFVPALRLPSCSAGGFGAASSPPAATRRSFQR